jgi:hypothetical protein
MASSSANFLKMRTVPKALLATLAPDQATRRCNLRPTYLEIDQEFAHP